MDTSLTESLLNKIIYSVSNTLDDITFETNWGTVIWSVHGDCCSKKMLIFHQERFFRLEVLK